MKYARCGLLIVAAAISIFALILAFESEIQRPPLGPENWPVTVEAVVDDLLPRLSLLEKIDIIFTREQKLSSLHFQPGVLIRNRYGLWRGNEKLILAACGYPCHADDASMPIIRAAWQRLHDCLSCLLPRRTHSGTG